MKLSDAFQGVNKVFLDTITKNLHNIAVIGRIQYN
ncbi:MAG: hypothetical protein RLZZ176_3214 [Cyanobacteriota bacterium]|jgi:hypothetical protein